MSSGRGALLASSLRREAHREGLGKGVYWFDIIPGTSMQQQQKASVSSRILVDVRETWILPVALVPAKKDTVVPGTGISFLRPVYHTASSQCAFADAKAQVC